MDRRVLLTAVVLAATASCAGPASPASVPPSPPDSTVSPTAPAADTAPESRVPASPANPETAPSPTTVPTVAPAGFATTLARVTEPDGEQCEICLWVAADATQRALGLMEVTDLEPGVGMAFVYSSPHLGTFWMKNTVMPLSIAFFAPDGAYLADFDMEPCADDPCPHYPTPAGFLIALEVPQGQLGAMGIGPGSRLELLGLPCADSA